MQSEDRARLVGERTREEVLSMFVNNLDLSVRARKGCHQAVTGTTYYTCTVEELIQLSGDELLARSKNFGMTSLKEVREKLQQLGVALRGD